MCAKIIFLLHFERELWCFEEELSFKIFPYTQSTKYIDQKLHFTNSTSVLWGLWENFVLPIVQKTEKNVHNWISYIKKQYRKYWKHFILENERVKWSKSFRSVTSIEGWYQVLILISIWCLLFWIFDKNIFYPMWIYPQTSFCNVCVRNDDIF